MPHFYELRGKFRETHTSKFGADHQLHEYESVNERKCAIKRRVRYFRCAFLVCTHDGSNLVTYPDHAPLFKVQNCVGLLSESHKDQINSIL